MLLALCLGVQAAGAVCLTEQERALGDALNAHRLAMGLRPVPFSLSLTEVAQAHAADLERHRPHQGACGLPSWSGGGGAVACCYTADHQQARCMWNKPRELTGYPGDGHELTFQGKSGDALDVWLGDSAHRAVVDETGSWQGAAWQAMGIAVGPDTTHLWLGRETDPAGAAHRCGAGPAPVPSWLNGEEALVPVGDLPPPPTEAGRHGTQWVAVHNGTQWPVNLHGRFLVWTGSAWRWDGPHDWLLEPGEVRDLEVNGHRVAARRLSLWAETVSGENAWHRDREAVVDLGGVYSGSMKVYTYHLYPSLGPDSGPAPENVGSHHGKWVRVVNNTLWDLKVLARYRLWEGNRWVWKGPLEWALSAGRTSYLAAEGSRLETDALHICAESTDGQRLWVEYRDHALELGGAYTGPMETYVHTFHP